VPNDTNGTSDVFVRDLHMGTTRLVSVNRSGTDSGNGGSFGGSHPSGRSGPLISADGRFVAFTSGASDLAAIATNGTNNVFVRDLQTNATTLVTVNQSGTGGLNNPNIFALSPAMSADGRFVAFVSDSNDVVPNDTNGTGDVFVRDWQLGTTTLVSVNRFGTDSGNAFSVDPVMSADGRFVAFASEANDLVSNDTNAGPLTTGIDVFVRDLQTAVTTLASLNGTGTGSGNRGSLHPAISADGRFVGFLSASTDLLTMGATAGFNLFVRDRQAGTTACINANRLGMCGGGSGLSAGPMLSADGRFAAFVTSSSDLVATDTNGETDVFVRDLETGTTTLASVNRFGTDSGNGYSHGAVLSPDGRFVAFKSLASDLVAIGVFTQENLFVRPVP
jgi:Tol biopolymer transport system component